MNARPETARLETELRGDTLVITAFGSWSIHAQTSEARAMGRAADAALAALPLPGKNEDGPAGPRRLELCVQAIEMLVLETLEIIS